MKICFVDTTKLEYTHKDIDDKKIRGSESSIINLSKKLSELGNDVCIFNHSKVEIVNNKYSWQNISKIEKHKQDFDVVISNNDSEILSIFDCKKKYVLSHSILNIEKAIRKKQFFSYFANKPKYLLLGSYHKKKMSKIFSIYGNYIINYGVDEIFENQIITDNYDKNLSFFTSRQDRNLNLLIDVWKNGINQKRKESKLFITPISKDLISYNIYNREMLNKKAFIDDIIRSRMIILPGHKAELSCLAAMEASELCLPIVTMGIGSLSERVEHLVTGLVSKSKKDFTENILELYNNDALWNEIKFNLKLRRGSNSWSKIANDFNKVLQK